MKQAMYVPYNVTRRQTTNSPALTYIAAFLPRFYSFCFTARRVSCTFCPNNIYMSLRKLFFEIESNGRALQFYYYCTVRRRRTNVTE